MPRFRLLSTDGENLGLLRAAIARAEGDRIPQRGKPDLIVVRLTRAEPGDDVDGYLVVKPSA